MGRNFYQELDEIILSIQQQYFGPVQRALIVCLKDAYSKMRARSPRSLPPESRAGALLLCLIGKNDSRTGTGFLLFAQFLLTRAIFFYYNSGI